MARIEKDDLFVFKDIGTDFYEAEEENGSRNFKFTMNSMDVSISISRSGNQIIFTVDNEHAIYPNEKALFGSPYFGDLHRWASNQSAFLNQNKNKNLIPIKGELTHSNDQIEHINDVLFDDFLRRQSEVILDVIIIDGPAGIGKTTEIQRIALNRAQKFSTAQNALILHVESTGRVMQNLDDLIAGSLQKIRAKPTFDQLRVLVKHGLVTLAIDGFDELADPNGYQQSWNQLRDLLDDVFGEGQVILSGRETFVSMQRMLDALPILTRSGVSVSQYRLKEVDPQDAKNWLHQSGLSTEILDNEKIADLLTPGSYGLRPFFLSTIVNSDIINLLHENPAADLLSFLVGSLIYREQNKFGDDIAKSIGREQLGTYVRFLCEEIARDMADNQSESLPGQSLQWAAEICLPEGISKELGRTLIHRAETLPFLSPDRERNSIRFSHRQYLVFFLGSNAIRRIADSEIPRYIRRNILGSEFLETFSKVILSMPFDIIIKFRDQAISLLPDLNTMDRSAGNAAALLLSCCCEFPKDQTIIIKDLSIDEIYLRGEVPSIEFKSVTISMLHAMKTDLKLVKFSGDSHIVAMHIDSLTRISSDFPTPNWLEDEYHSYKTPQDIVDRLHGAAKEEIFEGFDFPYDKDLLDRILRYRPFWLRVDPEGVEPAGKHIIEHPHWESALSWLEERDLVRVERRYPASGRPARFVHFRAFPLPVR